MTDDTVQTVDARTDSFLDLIGRHRTGEGHDRDGRAGEGSWLTVLAAFFTTLSVNDIDGLCDLMTEDGVIEFPFNESGLTDRKHLRSYRGRAEVREFWSATFLHEGVTHGIGEAEISVADSGSRVFLEFTGHLTMENGREYRNHYVLRFDIRDGLIALYREYYNPIQSAYTFDRPVAGRFRLEAL